MGPAALHGLRRRSRRIAAATVAVFALNWLGLALMPCAMAYAVPAAPVADAAAAAASGAASADCSGHAAAGGPAAAPDAARAESSAGEPCAWCPDGVTAAGAHDGACAATPKPALDSRDAKNPVTPLLVALAATVLGSHRPHDAAAGFPAADPVVPPAAPAVDRYCRRLE